MSPRHAVLGSIRFRLALYSLTCLALSGCEVRTEVSPPFARKQSWELSFNRGDSAAIAGLYSQNAELIMSGALPIHGRRAIGKAIAKLMQPGITVQIGTTRAAAAGQLAYFYGSYRVFRQQNVIEQGTYLEVWHRYGGHWLIDLDVNASGPPVASTVVSTRDR